MMPDEGRLLTCYLAEYNSLRAEQLSRLQTQTQSFNYLLVVLGAAIGAVVTSLTKPELFWSIQSVLFAIGLLLPILAGPLAFIFFDNEMAVYSIGSRIHADLRPRLATTVGDLEVFANALGFKNLHPSSIAIHGRLSMARWVLFLLPTVLPTLGVCSFLLLNWDRLLVFFGKFVTGQAVLMAAFLIVVFLLDIVMCILTVQAITWSFRTSAVLHNVEEKQR